MGERVGERERGVHSLERPDQSLRLVMMIGWLDGWMVERQTANKNKKIETNAR